MINELHSFVWSQTFYRSYILYIFLPTGGTGPIMGDLWALKGVTEEGISSYLLMCVFAFEKNMSC
jgi:hypothetical protein